MDVSSGDEFMYCPTIPINEEASGFNEYSLPDGEYASEQTLRKETPIGALSGGPASRTTFGGGGGAAAAFATESAADAGRMNALQELLSEIGYLGDVIVK